MNFDSSQLRKLTAALFVPSFALGASFGLLGCNLSSQINTPGSITVSPDSVKMTGVALGSSQSQILTLTNSGGASATLNSVTAAALGLSAPFSLTGGSCLTGTTLANGSSCTLVITYSPTVAGGTSTQFTLNYTNGVEAANLPVTLSATATTPNPSPTSTPTPSAALAQLSITRGPGTVTVGSGWTAGNAAQISLLNNTSVLLTADSTDVVTATPFHDSGCTNSAVAGTVVGASATASNGIATFTGFFYTKIDTIYLQYSVGAITVCDSTHPITAIAGPVTSIAFATQPSTSATTDNVLSTQPVVAAYDFYSNLVASAASTITLSAFSDTCVSSVGGGLSGATAAESGGLATFSTAKILKTNVNHLQASDGTHVVCSSSLSVNPGAIASLAFSTQPSTGLIACSTLPSQPVLKAYDANSNLVTTNSSAAITLTAYSDACVTPVASGVGATTNPLTLASGVASFSGVSLKTTAVSYLGASDGTHATCSSLATATNPLSITTAPNNQLYPLSANASPPLTQAAASAYTFTTVATDQCSSNTVTYSCTYKSLGLSVSDPNYAASGTNCALLPSLITSAGVIQLGTASFSSNLLTWWPTATQRGTFAFTVTAADAISGGSATTTFYETVRENFAAPASLLGAWDAQAATSVTGVSASIPAGPNSGASTSWVDLLTALNETLSSASWLGNGTSASPYLQSFSGTSGSYLNMSTLMGANNTIGFSAWLNPNNISTKSSVILSNGGTALNGSGLTLKQSDTAAAGIFELQLGGGPFKSYNATNYYGYPAVIIGDAPNVYYRLDDTTITLKDTMANLNGTYSGGYTQSQSGPLAQDSNTSVLFSGTNDLVTAADNALLKPSTLTLEAWVNPSSYCQYGAIITKTSSGGWSDGYGLAHLAPADNKVYFWVNAYSNASAIGAVVPTGAWSHVVGTYDGLATRIFVNGTLVNSAAYSTAITHSTAPFRIANGQGSTSSTQCNSNNYSWNGGIDEVAVYGYALSGAQVAAHYNAGLARFYANPILAAQPYSYWRLGEKGGAFANDLSGGGRNGTYVGTVNFGTAAPASIASGDSDTAITFDGTTGYVGSIGTTSDYSFIQNTGVFSVVAWSKFNNYLTDRLYIAGNAYSASQKGFYVGSDPNSHTYYGNFFYGASSGVATAPAAATADNNWHHIAYTGDGSHTYIYIDGTLQGTGTISALSTGVSAGALELGNITGGNYFTPGSLDEVAIFNYKLTAQQISQIRSAGAYTKCLSTTPLANGAWNLLSGFWDGTSLALFVNGQQQCKIAPTNNYGTPSTPLYVGAAYNGSSDSNDWAGSVADLKVYGTTGSAPLPSTQIQTDFSAEANRFRANPVPDFVTSGLVLNLDAANANAGIGTYYSGAAGSCNSTQLQWPDLASGQLFGSLLGFSGCGSTQGWTGNGTGASPYALTFNGSAAQVITSQPINISGNAAYTISAWVKLNASANWGVLGWGNVWLAGATAGLAYGVEGANVLSAEFAGAETVFPAAGTVPANQWVHIAYTKAPGAINTTSNFYLNGASLGALSASSSSATPSIVSSPLYLGHLANYTADGNALNAVGEVQIYNQTLTQSQIRQNCRAFASRYGITCN